MVQVQSIRAHSFTAYRKAVRFIYGPFEGRTVYHIAYLRSVGRLYSSFTAHQKAV
jgi:hypothetical protein